MTRERFERAFSSMEPTELYMKKLEIKIAKEKMRTS
jgi:hypothetical protein